MSQSHFFLEGLHPGCGKITGTPDVCSAVSWPSEIIVYWQVPKSQTALSLPRKTCWLRWSPGKRLWKRRCASAWRSWRNCACGKRWVLHSITCNTSCFVIAPSLELGWGQEMRFLPQSPLTKPIVPWPQGDPAVSAPHCKVQGFFPHVSWVPCWLGARRLLSIHVCALKLWINCIQPGFLLTLIRISCYLNAIGRLFYVLVITSQRLFTPLAKIAPRLAHFLLGAGPTLHAFFSSPSMLCHTAHKVLSAPCRLPSSSQLWPCWKGIPVWRQTLERGNTVVIPGHAGQLRNS